MGAILGKDFYLYRDTDQPYDGTPVYEVVSNIKDLTRGLEKALADASTRGTGGFRAQLGTLKDLSLEFQMVYDPDDTDVIAFQDAFFSDDNIQFVILDGPISTTGSKGIRFMGQITNFSINEALEDVGLVDVSIVPGYDTAAANQPKRVTVSAPNVLTES